jgi:ribose transport system permease protein
MKKQNWTIVKNMFPILGFFLIVLIFSIATGGAMLAKVSLQSLLNQVMTISLVSIGAVFIFGSGNFDLSLSGSVALSAVLAGYAAIATGNLLIALLTSISVALLVSLLKGVFAAFIDVPLFIVTIVLGSMITALVLVIMGDDATIYLSEAVKEIPSFTFGELTAINLVILGGYFVFCLILFNYTSLGRKIKLIGGNQVTARHLGINLPWVKISAFLVSGLGVGLAAFALLIRTRTVGTTSAGSVGMNVLVALVLGGMPLTGGPRSRISAGLVGAASIAVLNAGLTMVGFSLAMVQISRAIIFLAIVYLASMSYRTKLLPR